MRTRNNFNIIGQNQSPINTGTNKGVFSIDDQRFAAQANSWPKITGFNYDSNAANIFLAMTLTSYSSSLTGGALKDVGPLIRTAQGLSAGTTRNPTSNGNGTISSVIASPFTQYSDNYLWANASSTADLLYWGSTALSVTGNVTIEMWLYQPSSNTSQFAIFTTNDFSGGYYAGTQGYANANKAIGMFTNYGSSAASSDNAYTANNWFHVAYVFTAGAMSIYLNGTRIVNSGSSSAGQNTLSIGGTSWDGLGSATSRVGWRMQDIRIYTVAKYSGASFSLNLTNPNLGGAILI